MAAFKMGSSAMSVLLVLARAAAADDGWLHVRDAQHPARWPPPSAAQRAAAAELMARIANGSFPLLPDGLKRPAWLPRRGGRSRPRRAPARQRTPSRRRLSDV
jgi:hypothetical protein